MFLRNDAEDGCESIEELDENSQVQETEDTLDYDPPNAPTTAKGGIYRLNEVDDFSAKLASPTKQVEDFQMQKFNWPRLWNKQQKFVLYASISDMLQMSNLALIQGSPQ